MFKILKFSILITFLNFSFSYSEILKPNYTIKPKQVVKIQLDGLKSNDSSYKDKGIEQTWEFAHPNNKIFTGPLDRFKQMLKGESYKMLLNHEDHKISEVYSDQNKAIFEVVVMDREKKYFRFKWQVERYLQSGPLENCWLTTVVSAPIPLGSSI
tara:strand:+ start:1490 stop:1954 length:465 start_codon:yes stop_codon:yes gene_type:complete